MKIQTVFLMTALSGVMTLCSCSEEVLNNKSEGESRLTVVTRADEDSGGTSIAMPVRLYVFDEEGTCVETSIQEDTGTPFAIELPEGTYEVYAIGGADESRLVLPSREDARQTTAIALKVGQALDDLMAAHAHATLSADGSNTVALNMARKVCLVTDVIIKNVPEGTEAVSVSIAPLYESMLLNGSYQGEGGSCTIDLKKGDEGSDTWKDLAGNRFLMPSVGKPTITVAIGDATYAYTCEEEMAGNYKISIEGTYTGKGGTASIVLSGTITGVTWEGEESIHFNFNEEGSDTEK